MSSLEVREAVGDDWPTWRELRLRALRDAPSAFGSTYERERDYPDRLWRDRLAEPDGVSVLGFDDAVPVGMAAGYQDLPGWLHVVAMWVAPSRRRLGLSHLLLDVVREWAVERGLRLHLDVARGNPAARTSYQRYGFVLTGESRPIRDGAAELVDRLVLPRH